MFQIFWYEEWAASLGHQKTWKTEEMGLDEHGKELLGDG